MSDKAVAELNEAVIRFALELYDNGKTETLNHFGIDKDDIAALRSLSVGSMRAMRNYTSLVMDFKFNSGRARHLVKHIQHETDKLNKVNRMIELGASQKMLEEMVGIDREEFRKMRSKLDMNADERGRPRALNDHESNLVNEIMIKNSDFEQIDLYILIGMETGIPLSSVWTYNRTMQM